MNTRRAAADSAESVLLECNGELADIRSVAIVGMREAMPGIELVEFRCPCCGSTHESLRFLPIPDTSVAAHCAFTSRRHR